MRKSLLIAAAMLGACAAANTSGATPVRGVTPGYKCRTNGTDIFLAQVGSRATGAAIKRTTKAAVLRWSPPNTMLTMDYREDRVTVWLDKNKKITKIRCG
jgi:hypothetical protein